MISHQAPFEPPPYPYDRLSELRLVAEAHAGGCVDLSVGTPTDPPPEFVLAALSGSGAERGYPPSVGTEELRDAAASWILGRFGVEVARDQVAACVGTKELVVGLPHLLRLRRPDRDTVLHPQASYPSYAMGAILAGCAAVAVPSDAEGRLALEELPPAVVERALCLWVNSPQNPSGVLEDLAAVASWGQVRGIPVLSDECYVEFTWDGPPRSILQERIDGVLAVHSLSKRSNLAGLRAGFYAGDPDLVGYLSEVRKHAGLMVPGPVQHAAAAALADQSHVQEQRERYRARLSKGLELLRSAGAEVDLPSGGFYLWAKPPDGDAWGFAKKLASEGGALVAPGELYGVPDRVRAAMVQPERALELVAARMAG